MYGCAKIMFCWPGDSLEDKIIGTGIQWAESGDYPSHVVIELPDFLCEAVARGVDLSPKNKYINRRHETYSISVPFIECSDAMIENLRGRKYGYISCLAGFLRDKYNIKVPWISSAFDDCSEAATIYLAGMGLRLFGLDSPEGITPKDLYEAVKKVGKFIDEK